VVLSFLILVPVGNVCAALIATVMTVIHGIMAIPAHRGNRHHSASPSGVLPMAHFLHPANMTKSSPYTSVVFIVPEQGCADFRVKAK
jgi:hypothetical protein